MTPLQPGQLLARGVSRHLASHGFASVEELVPTRGLRVDVMALGPKGEVWVVECKSSRADFQTDQKWQGYLEWCDRYFFNSHRNEHRGIGGVFFDHLRPGEKLSGEALLAFQQEIAETCFIIHRGNNPKN